MYIGIDGCRGGWVIATLNEKMELQLRVVQHLEALHEVPPPVRALIDMPIGYATTGYRLCDMEAQKLLGARKRASVFFTPHRAAVYAATYAEANALNRLHIGRGLSKQAWNICGKIKEVALFLQTHEYFPLYEAHPELCFSYLNHGQVLLSKKATPQGAEERMAIIEVVSPTYRQAIEACLLATKRKDVKPDDLLDATILAIRAGAADLQQVPGEAAGEKVPKIWF